MSFQVGHTQVSAPLGVHSPVLPCPVGLSDATADAETTQVPFTEHSSDAVVARPANGVALSNGRSDQRVRDPVFEATQERTSPTNDGLGRLRDNVCDKRDLHCVMCERDVRIKYMIWMKFLGCIEFTLKPCTVVFSTSGLDLKIGNWNFPEKPDYHPM